MVVYDDTSVEPVRVFDSGVTYRDPETFGEFHLSYRTGDIVSPHLDSSEPLALEAGRLRREHPLGTAGQVPLPRSPAALSR